MGVLQAILDLIKKYGVLPVLLLGSGYILYPYVKRYLDFRASIHTKSITKEDLLNHSYFSKMKYWLKIEIPNINIADKCKLDLTRRFLSIKFTVFREGMFLLLHDERVFYLPNEDMILYVYNYILDLIEEYEKKAIKMGIPELYVKKFSMYHAKSLVYVDTAMRGICNSLVFSDNYFKISAILDIILSVFAATMADIDHVIKDLNGELDVLCKQENN